MEISNEIITGEQFTEINDWMFSHLRINFRIPDTVTKVGEFAFAISTITKVTIPSSVQTIGESAFFHCWYTKEAIIEDGDLLFYRYVEYLWLGINHADGGRSI